MLVAKDSLAATAKHHTALPYRRGCFVSAQGFDECLPDGKKDRHFQQHRPRFWTGNA